MGLLMDRMKKLVSGYGNRRKDVIYAHNLDDTVWVALEEEGVPEEILNNPYVLIGELVHRGLPDVLRPAHPLCKRVFLPEWLPARLDARIVDRWVKRDDGKPYVVVCGKCDAFWNEYPVEFKTTRVSHDNGFPVKWIRRTETYAWLYDVDEALLIVLNLVTGDEHDLFVKKPGDFEERVVNWLRGRYPYYSLMMT